MSLIIEEIVVGEGDEAPKGQESLYITPVI